MGESVFANILHCFVNSCHKQWSHRISLTQFWYNTSHHSAIGRSPFEALYGRSPRCLGVTAYVDAASAYLEKLLQDHQVIMALIKQHLHHASLRMKQQADKGRLKRVFREGDMVFLKLQSYVQSSLAPKANQKLAYKFFGPYKILQKVSSIAYKLKLPATSSIHPIFHVPQLKKVLHGSVTPPPTLPGELPKLQVPDKVLQHRMVSRGLRSVQQGLIQWSNSLPSLATWEDIKALKQRFPDAPAWGQVGSYGGSCHDPCSYGDGANRGGVKEDQGRGPARKLTCKAVQCQGDGPKVGQVMYSPTDI
jgi:hypothetical protein